MNDIGTSPVIQDYRDLTVWNAAMDLAVETYKATKSFPGEERYGMTSQMRRAANSIPANIAEGFGRGQTKPFIQFLRIAQGSAREIETHILLCQRVSLLDAGPASHLLGRTTEISKMLGALIRSLSKKVER